MNKNDREHSKSCSSLHVCTVQYHCCPKVLQWTQVILFADEKTNCLVWILNYVGCFNYYSIWIFKSKYYRFLITAAIPRSFIILVYLILRLFFLCSDITKQETVKAVESKPLTSVTQRWSVLQEHWQPLLEVLDSVVDLFLTQRYFQISISTCTVETTVDLLFQRLITQEKLYM